MHSLNLARISDRESNLEEVDNEFHYLKNALEFSTTKARECMIPRTDMVALDVNDPISELKNLFIESGHSKIIVYDELNCFVRSFQQGKQTGKPSALIF